MKLLGNGGIRPLEQPEDRCTKWQLWQFVQVEDDPDAKTQVRQQKTRLHRGRKKSAKRALEVFREDLRGEIPNAETFRGYTRRWLAWAKDSGDFTIGTLSNYECNIKALCRVLGECRMDEIDSETIRDALNKLKHGGGEKGLELSGTYMNKIYSTLSLIMKQATADRRISYDPCLAVKRPKIDTSEKEWMEPEELIAFTNKLLSMELDAHVMAVLLIAETGLRRGEACGLFDSDVDLANNVIHVRHAIKERDGSIGKPKTKAGQRDLYMSDTLKKTIKKWRQIRKDMGLGDATTLCCSVTGTPLRPQNLYRWWELHREELGAEEYTLHQIRHSNLSRMARYFPSPFDLKDWAGWTSLEPAQVYIHKDMSAQERAVKLAQAEIA